VSSQPFAVPAVHRPHVCCPRVCCPCICCPCVCHPCCSFPPFIVPAFVVPHSWSFPVIRHSHSPPFIIPCRSSFPAAVVSRNSSSVVCQPGSPCSLFPAIRHRRHSSSSAPPYPPTSSGLQAGWWHCVTWHLRVVVVQKRGPLQSCEQMLTAAA
jgi:hypothetical protein